MAHETQSYRYAVSADDVVVAVDTLWLAFARENGAAELTESSVLGRSLWDFVEGEALRAVYSDIHARVRAAGKTATFYFRCDSPLLKRHMRMTISPGETGQLIYASQVVWTEPQRNLALLDVDRLRSKSYLTICSCCKKAMLEPDGWQDIESVSRTLGLLETGQVPQLRHTICPACSETMRNCVANSEVA